MPRTKQRTEQLREHIVQAAVAMLAADGVEAFTTRKVAEQAHTSPPAVYELFGDKAGLVREVFFEGFRLLGDRFGRLRESGNPRADLIRAVQAFRIFVRDNPVLGRVMFSRPFADFDPGPADLEAGATTREFIVHRVQRCIDAGIIDGDQTDIAHALLALAQGLAMQEAAGRLGSSRASVDRRWDLAVRALLAGLGPASPEVPAARQKQLDTPIPAAPGMQVQRAPVPLEQGRRARHVAAMRGRLVEVSLDLYDRQGFSATTIDQIAATANVHRSTFFRYFESKEGVLLAPLTRSHLWFVDALGARPAGEPLVRGVAVVCTEGEWPAVERAQLQKIRRIVNADPLLRVAVEGQLSSAFAPLLVERLRAMNPGADDGEVSVVSALAVMWSNAAFSRLIEHGGALRTHFAEVIGATRKAALETP